MNIELLGVSKWDTQLGAVVKEAALWMAPAIKSGAVSHAAIPSWQEVIDFVNAYIAAAERNEVSTLAPNDSVGATWPSDQFAWMVSYSKTTGIMIESVMAMAHALWNCSRTGKIPRAWIDPVRAKKDTPKNIFDGSASAAKSTITPIILGLGAIAAGYLFLTKKRT